ncbi:hypothetical protein P3S67_009279 [Capsicum chacoense]
MVKLICWNTRGLNGLNKQKEVKLLCSYENIGMICFLEIRIKANKIRDIADRMFSVTYAVKFIPLQLEFDVTFVYAFNLREERVELWDYLRKMHQICSKAWMVLGDFNVVLHKEDRMGGNAVTLAEVHDFQCCVEDCLLEETPSN